MKPAFASPNKGHVPKGAGELQHRRLTDAGDWDKGSSLLPSRHGHSAKAAASQADLFGFPNSLRSQGHCCILELETEAQRGEVTCSKSQGKSMVERAAGLGSSTAATMEALGLLPCFILNWCPAVAL